MKISISCMLHNILCYHKKYLTNRRLDGNKIVLNCILNCVPNRVLSAYMMAFLIASLCITAYLIAPFI